MIEPILEKLVAQPLDALADFTDRYGLVPFYVRNQNWTFPPSWQPNFLALAVQAGLIMYVKHVLESRIDIRSVIGRPLLHYAVLLVPESLSKGRRDPFLTSPKMLKFLIQFGADVRYKFKGRTAFAFVFKKLSDRGQINRDQLNMLETLLRGGLGTEEPVGWLPYQQDIWSTDEFDYRATSNAGIPVTVFQLAVRKSDLQAANLLLQYGARIEILTEEDWRVLRNGYLYGNEIPNFENTDMASIEEKREAWLKERERAIREGKIQNLCYVLFKNSK